MKNHYDVIIVGCGLVGGSLALSLPETLTIAVIDAESPMHQQPGFLALNRLSCHILDLMGVWNAIAAYSEDSITPIKNIAISECGNSSVDSLILHGEDIGAAALGYVTSTTAIRETLLPQIQSRKNITLYCPAKAEEIQWPNDGIEHVLVKLSNNLGKMTAKLAVIADGGRSTLRQQLYFDVHEKNKETTDKKYHIGITRLKSICPHQHQAFERFTSEGPIALLPIAQAEYVLVWTMNSTCIPDFLEQDENSLLTRLKMAYGNKSFQGWQEIGPRRTYPIVCSYVKKPYKTRLVLMGNAAHSVHPVGAQGFNLSLKDALTLNQCIRRALDNQHDIGSEYVLKNYAESRQHDTNFVLYFTQSLLNIFSWDVPLFTQVRSRIMSWLNQSSHIKQLILEKTAGLPNSSPQKCIREHHQSPLLSTNKHYDIIILGNRLIGSTLACALNSRYRIAILDKTSTPSLPATPSDKPTEQFQLRINAYNRASEELLRTLGIWQKLPPERLFAFDKVFATYENNDLSFCSRTIGEPHLGHFIENDLVTYTLHQHIHTLPHIDFIDDASVISIDNTSKTTRITSNDGRIFSAKLLAACDGAQSITRQLLGLSVSYHAYFQRCIVCNIFFDGDLDKTAWQHFLKTGPIGLLPLRPGVCSLAWSCDNEEAKRLLTLSDELFTIELSHATRGRLGNILQLSARQSFPLRAQHLEHYLAERTLFLGDAAHTIHPLGGLGANLGFQDVIAAATLLNDTQNNTRDIGRRYLLKKYETMRRRHNARVMDMMTVFNAMFHQTHPLLNSLGRFSLNIANHITPLKNALFHEAMWMNTSAEKIRRL